MILQGNELTAYWSKGVTILSKQVDFIREEEKLSEILEILNKEILKYLEKSKECHKLYPWG